MPPPRSVFSPKELELVSLMARNKSDAEIGRSMHIKELSVPPLVCAATQRLELKSRQELVNVYLDYQKHVREHQHRRCLKILKWLLHPPAMADRPYWRYRECREVSLVKAQHSAMPGLMFLTMSSARSKTISTRL